MTQLVRVAYPAKFAAQAPGAQFGAQTASHANSTSPTSATLSNTAASYTTLGGRWQIDDQAEAATDFALFAYQIPSTHRLLLTGVAISAVVMAALGGPAVLDWSLGINATAVSLATTDSGSTFGPRRIPLGVQGLVGAAPAIGLQAPDIVRQFNSPLLIEPGRYLHTILQLPEMTAGSGVIRGDVWFDGWFEPTGTTYF